MVLLKVNTQTNETAFYSLDAIIAVGYRVSSARATKFIFKKYALDFS